ncbi:MAG TPA: DUF996 domain-containing protein [Candidatus Dormibacteraeota bacterium]|jgi:uncharacterized membrane protein|nr:DUF996 domain-containing protein [Candidatus Dormibacteraeota bacterium]
MASLSNAKTLGGVGGILVFIPGVSLVGWILILVALKDISEVLQDKTIFDDALVAGIMAILGSVVLFFVAFSPAVIFRPLAFPLIWAAVALFAVFAIISAVFLKRAYDKIAPRLNVQSFTTAGLLFLIGTITTIIFIGFLILFIALIFQVIAYFSIRDQPPGPYSGFQSPQPTYPMSPPTMQPAPMQPPQATPIPQTQPSSEFKYCFKCGTRLSRSADFCTSCGAKQS